jgi:hypothetical protein
LNFGNKNTGGARLECSVKARGSGKRRKGRHGDGFCCQSGGEAGFDGGNDEGDVFFVCEGCAVGGGEGGVGGSIDELDERVDDSVNESVEEDEDDKERAEELVVETKELVTSVEEEVEDAEDEEVLSWTAEEELITLEDELEDAWVEDATELLEADEDEEMAEELEEDAATEELDEAAEEERVRDAEDEEIGLELALDDEEGLWTPNWEAIEASLDETLDSTLEILDWTLEIFAGMMVVAGTAFEEEEVVFEEEELGFEGEVLAFDNEEDLRTLAWEATEASLEETFDSTLEILDWMLETFAGVFEVAGTTFAEEDEVFLAELVDEVFLTDEEEVFLAELVEELFLLEEVIFALVLLEEEEEEEEEDFFDMEEVARNSGRTIIAPPTRVVGATKSAPTGARSTRSTSMTLTLRGAATAALARRETRATWLMDVSKRMIGGIREDGRLKDIKKIVWSSEWNNSRRWHPRIFEESCTELLLNYEERTGYGCYIFNSRMLRLEGSTKLPESKATCTVARSIDKANDSNVHDSRPISQ